MSLNETLQDVETKLFEARCMNNISVDLFEAIQTDLMRTADQNLKESLERFAFSLYHTLELVDRIRPRVHEARSLVRPPF